MGSRTPRRAGQLAAHLGENQAGDVLYERRNNSTRAIPESEARTFLRERFGPSFDLDAGEGRATG